MIGRRLASLSDVLNRHDVQVYVSEAELNEIRTVIERPKFNNIISQNKRYHFCEMVYDLCRFTDITVDALSPIRDPKDIYLLSMAESVPVDYIVSGDRDLTDLGQHNGIPIIKYNQLLDILKINTEEE